MRLPESTLPTAPTKPLLSVSDWTHQQQASLLRVDRILRLLGCGERRAPHPVYDFLSTYYHFPLRRLRQWSPGAGIKLTGPGEEMREMEGRTGWRVERSERGAMQAWVDPALLPARRREGLAQTVQLLRATANRPAFYGCFGLHEWAMIYRSSKIRHTAQALRLSAEEIARVVETGPVRCTHYDAFRFFTAAARPLNQIQPGPETRAEFEQPGCLHANMDLYRHAAAFYPWVGSDLILDCLELAVEIREVDMRASPYDLRRLGFEPIPIERGEGRRQYEELQRRFAQRAGVLRQRLMASLQCLWGVR